MRTVLKRLRQRLSREQGGGTIEFSLIFIIFVFFIFLIFEINRFLYVSASLDLTLSEAARMTSRTEQNNGDYTALFAANVAQESAFWKMFVDPKNFTLKVTYCRSVKDSLKENCFTGAGQQYPLAIYSAGYRYRPLLFAFDNNSAVKKLVAMLDASLSRKLVYVQEYERGDQ